MHVICLKGTLMEPCNTVRNIEASTLHTLPDGPVPPAAEPELIVNNKAAGTDLLSVIKRELSSCIRFDLCVAFITEGGLQPLVAILSELRRHEVHGRLLTSTYLDFNSPSIFTKLLDYDNIETRVYQGNLHAKGYLFDHPAITTCIVGSSNLTQLALTCNKEWNVLYRSHGTQAYLNTLREEFSYLWNDSQTTRLSMDFISAYTKKRREAIRVSPTTTRDHLNTNLDKTHSDSQGDKIQPNQMQARALDALAALHARNTPRALIISATGTGKTFLSAFDIRSTKPHRILFLAHRQRILDASHASYETLLGDSYTFVDYSPNDKIPEGDICLFAMCSTICKHLQELKAEDFDYVVIDEAHRAGSKTYRSILDYFKPSFILGMTATPTRTDGQDVFKLFNHVIAFQISLQDALENDMLAPFHYFGIADLSIDDENIEDVALFSRLTSDERVKHVSTYIEEYTVNRKTRKGLIFCSRNDEAAELSRKFNELGYRTEAVSGESSDAEREKAIRRLETGELEYIFSVDIFNEGIDIPALNQVIMLRKTESAIIFVQQLGRGLRKAPGKDYLLVLDFIGNYQQNYLVPIALSGDRSYNKDTLRSIVNDESAVIPGCSTISFDAISKARIFKAIDCSNFGAAKLIRDEYTALRNMLGRIPSLADFDNNNSLDPLRIFKKYGSYHAFLSKTEPGYNVHFDSDQENYLAFISKKLASGKRYEDLGLLYELIEANKAITYTDFAIDKAQRTDGRIVSRAVFNSTVNLLTGNFGTLGNVCPFVEETDSGISLTDSFSNALDNIEFRRQILEVLSFGMRRNAKYYSRSDAELGLTLNAKYTYEEVCCYLNWDKNINGQNLGGYKYDAKTNTYPVFINYEKDPDISESIKYEDRFINDTTLIAISKQPRTIDSPEIQRLKAWPQNGMTIYLFVRKNKDDNDGGKEFYYLGTMHPKQEYQPITIAGKNAVEITYELDRPVERKLFEYLTSNIDPQSSSLSF